MKEPDSQKSLSILLKTWKRLLSLQWRTTSILMKF